MTRLLVIDGNPPWVRSLFAAMPPEVQVDLLRVYSAIDFFRNRRGRIRDLFHWRKIDSRTRELTVLVPGWSKLFAISSTIIRWVVCWIRAKPVPVAAMIFTSPYYARVAQGDSRAHRFYLAHDVFRFYDWDTQEVQKLEKAILDACDCSFVVARALAEDFQAITANPVEYSPMATTNDFIERIAKPPGPIPADLVTLPRPIVGCIGQINRS